MGCKIQPMIPLIRTWNQGKGLHHQAVEDGTEAVFLGLESTMPAGERVVNWHGNVETW
jgi:hypothetical protein